MDNSEDYLQSSAGFTDSCFQMLLEQANRGHWFLSLSTGKRIHCHKWADLPSSDDAINRVNTLAR
jgi:hypothetical protein